MRSIDDYLDLAKSATGARSDRRLSELLGFAGNGVTQFRTKRAWPSDDTMVEIAELARIDPAEALTDLARWRTTGKAHAAWQDVARRIGAAAALILIAAPAMAGTPAEQGNIDHNILKIMENK